MSTTGRRRSGDRTGPPGYHFTSTGVPWHNGWTQVDLPQLFSMNKYFSGMSGLTMWASWSFLILLKWANFEGCSAASFSWTARRLQGTAFYYDKLTAHIQDRAWSQCCCRGCHLLFVCIAWYQPGCFSWICLHKTHLQQNEMCYHTIGHGMAVLLGIVLFVTVTQLINIILNVELLKF